MSQVITKRNLTRGSLRGHEDARTVLLRMALDEGRAQRIHQLKQEHPELTWAQIAETVGVKERSAIDWQRTGGISHANAKKLAALMKVDADWLWSGKEPATPDLMGALNGDRSQLDRIEAKLDDLLSQVAALELGSALDAEGDQPAAPQRPPAEVPRRTNRSRKAS